MKSRFIKLIDNPIGLAVIFILFSFLAAWFDNYQYALWLYKYKTTGKGLIELNIAGMLATFIFGGIIFLVGLYRYRRVWLKFLITSAITALLLWYCYDYIGEAAYFLSRKLVLLFYHLDIG